MERFLMVATCLLAAMLLMLGVGWVFDPAGTAVNLGMVLLEGAGRSSQIGDGGSFFLGTGIMLVYGALSRNPSLLVAGALMIGGVAVLRVLAWAVHGAAFTAQPIVVEVLILVAGLALAKSYSGGSAAPAEAAAE